MEERKNFGKFIQSKRKAKGISQKEVADKLYVTESAVSKWERGISYPDISMIQGICDALEITEHELLTASDDYRQKEIEKNAKNFVKTTKIYSYILYAVYICSLVPCFITNIAVNGKLSWFFIVLLSEAVAFTLLNVPLLVKSHKGLWTIGSFYVSLNALLAGCCIYTHGSWYPTAFLSVTFGMAIVFIPLILLDKIFPEKIRKHNALISLSIDSVLLIILCMFSSADKIEALTICAFELILVWLSMIVIRYIKINGFFKTAVCLILFGFYALIEQPVVNKIIDKKPFLLDPINFKIWNETYLNGNIMIIIMSTCIFAALLFLVGGIINECKKKDG